MRLFMAALATETNTSSPLPTGRAAFLGGRYSRRDGSLHDDGFGNVALKAWRQRGTAAGFDIVESISATAQPGGLTVRAVHEELRGLILADLREAMPVDIVLLALHGAMVADGYDDCEGDLVAAVRRVVGPSAVIGVELDLHCHLSSAIIGGADLVVLYKEYPHVDIADRAHDLFGLAVRAARREIRPVMACRDLRMISTWRTPAQPMRGIVDAMTAAEGRGGLLSLSFCHGFGWADVADVGARMLAIADGDHAIAERAAADFAQRIWQARDACVTRRDTPDEAIDAVIAAPRGRPVIIADTIDNAGGGAPSDATHILRRCRERGLANIALGAFWDPGAVAICLEAGAGARLPLRVGGKASRTGGMPVDLDVTVRAVAEAHSQTGLSGARAAMGASAWVEADGIHLLINSNRQQVFHPDAFEGLGLDLRGLDAVFVKSSQHFYAGFAPIAQQVRYVATPGTFSATPGVSPYTKRTTPYWPLVEDPFAT